MDTKNKECEDIRHCLTCYKFKAQATQQLMGELPPSRVQPSRPFLTTGVDYAGPIQLRLGTPRSKTITKSYLAIFILWQRLSTLNLSQASPQKLFLLPWDVSYPVEANQEQFIQTMVPTSKVLPPNCMKPTKCFNARHRWQEYRTSWPPKDVTGNSSHMDRTSEDYGKQRRNPWNTTWEHWVLTSPPTRNCAHYLLRQRPV
jgi:hypothetical protein